MTLQDCYAVILSVADALIYENNTVAGRQLRAAMYDLRKLVDEATKEVKLPWPVPNENEMTIATREGKIPAIKAIRERLGIKLLEAKQSIEYYCPSFWDSYHQKYTANEKYKIDPR